MPKDNIQAAIVECILEDLYEAFNDSIFVPTMKSAQVSIRHIPAKWCMDDFTDRLPSTLDRIEVIIDYESRMLYQMAIMDDIIMVCGKTMSTSYCLAKERFDINEPGFGDICMRIKYAIIRDIIARYHQPHPPNIPIVFQTWQNLIFANESFTIAKDQTKLSSKGRLGLTLRQLIIPEQLSYTSVTDQLCISESNPIVISAVYRAEVIIDGDRDKASGVFALLLNSKMIQTNTISSGMTENLQLEDFGNYEIVLNVIQLHL